MLVLTRNVEQTICIGDDIKVKVLKMHKSQVQLGVTAPKNLPVHREEVFVRIKKEKKGLMPNTEQSTKQ